MIKEFRDFAMRGSLIDLAIGFIMGTAFGKIVTSLVNDVIMPPIGLVLGKVDFNNLFISLSGKSYTSLAEAQAAGAPTLNYGLFITNILDFLIVALVMFFVVKAMNQLKKAPAPSKPSTKDCPYCKTQIPLKATRCPNCTSELK